MPEIHFDLAEGARLAMLDAGFLTEFPAAARREASELRPASPDGPGVRDSALAPVVLDRRRPLA